MRKAMVPAGILWTALLAVLPPAFCGQGAAPDVSGTWVGQTEMPNTSDKVDVTLALKKGAKDYSGTISLAAAKNAPLVDFSWQDEDTLQFSFDMPGEGDPVRVKVKLDVISDVLQGNKRMGTWVMDDGSYGTLDLLRKK